MDGQRKAKQRARLRQYKQNLNPASKKSAESYSDSLYGRMEAEAFKKKALHLDRLFHSDSQAAIALSKKMLEAYQKNDLDTYYRLMKEIETL